MGFCRQEYWSGLPFLSPGDLHNPGIDPASLAAPVLPGRFFTTESPVKPIPSEISTFNQPKSILFPISKSLIFFCGSVAQSCPTLCYPMNCNTPGFPVLHHLPELAQTHVHRVGDAIQPSHPLSSPSPPAFNLSQHQSLLQWVSSLHQMAKILEFQLQHQSFQWIFRTDFLWTGLISLQSKGLSRVFSNTKVKNINYLVLSLLYGPTLTSLLVFSFLYP